MDAAPPARQLRPPTAQPVVQGGGGPIRRQRNRAGARVSRITFTLNNWTQAEYDDLVARAPTFKWMVIGKEVGEQGTPHLQGAIIFGAQISFSTLKLWPGLAKAHIEVMKGQPSDSLVYCSKEDTAPFVSGTMPEPGKRTDISLAVEQVQGGANLRQLATDNGVAVVKFAKGLTVLRSLLAQPRDPKSPPEVYWVWGETGTEKTRRCFELGERMAGTGNVWLSSGGLRWFDGYDGQSVAILDDFRPKGVPFQFFLRLLDRYPMSVEFKGGFVNWAPRVIFITTPNSISTTFAKRMEHLPEDVRQLERRVSKSFGFPEDYAEFDALFALRGELRVENVLAMASAPVIAPTVEEEIEELSQEFDNADFLN